MNRTDAPKKQPVVFGTNGQRENLPDTTPAGDNTASYDAGFPAVTMILKSAGGLPPKGQDMNQILFELSAIGRWLSAGALNAYDAAFSTAIGGYPKAAQLVGDDGTTIFISTIEANTNNPNTTTTGWLNLSKITAIAGLAGGVDTLPYFSGANTAAQTAITSVGRNVIGQTSIANLLTYLGLQDVANALIKTNNLSDLPDKAVSRTNLGVPAGVDKQMCTVWASWSNNGTLCTIKDSFGVSSVTRTSQGVCQVNFSASMANTNYAAVYSPGNGIYAVEGGRTGVKAVSNCSTQSWGGNGTGTGVAFGPADFPDNNIQIFGGK